MEELDQVDSKLESVNQQIEERVASESENDQRAIIKERIKTMKDEISKLTLREGLLKNQVEKFESKFTGKVY